MFFAGGADVWGIHGEFRHPLARPAKSGDWPCVPGKNAPRQTPRRRIPVDQERVQSVLHTGNEMHGNGSHTAGSLKRSARLGFQRVLL